MTMISELQSIVGENYVTTGKDLAAYSSDWVGWYSWKPLALVRPANTAEVATVVKWANENKTAIVPVSGNTGLNGGTHAEGAVMLSLDRLNKIREMRTDARVAVVEAGVIMSQLHDAADALNLVFPMTFGAKGSAMIGGMLSTNAGGSNVLRYGNTRDLCLGLEVVTPQGEIMDLMGALHKDNSGINLKHLMIGAEGTLGIITAAVMKLARKPLAYATAMLAVPNLDDALRLLNNLQQATGGGVEAFEYMTRPYVEAHMKNHGGGEPFDAPHQINILCEVGATAPRDADVQPDGSVPITSYLEDVLGQMVESGQVLDAVIAKNEAQRRQMWERREAAGEVLLSHKPLVNTDVSVALDDVSRFIRLADARMQQIDPGAQPMIVSHLGDGNVHYAVWPKTHDEAVHKSMVEAIEDCVVEVQGSFSAEHGIGISKLDTMSRRKDPAALTMMRTLKTALDPNNILNPGKVIPPAPAD
jgi:FAD/FMN-containing dehydrogenase